MEETNKKGGKGKTIILILSIAIICMCLGTVIGYMCYKKYAVNNNSVVESESVSESEAEIKEEVYSSFDGKNKLVIDGDNYKLNYVDITTPKSMEGNITKESESKFKLDTNNAVYKTDDLVIIKGLFETDPSYAKDLVLFNETTMDNTKKKLTDGAEKYLGEYFNGNEHAKATGYNLKEIYHCDHIDENEDMVCVMEYFIEFENYSKSDCDRNEKYAREMMPTCEESGTSSSYAIRYNYKTLEAIELASLND